MKHIQASVTKTVSKFLKHSSGKVGLAPGSVVHVGQKKVEQISIHVIDYDKHNVIAKHLDKVEDAFVFKQQPTTTWLDITGLHDTESIVKLGEHYGLHPLTQEDIVNTGQRPMLEDFQSYMFITLKMLLPKSDGEVEAEHVSLVVGKDYVFSFQERTGDVFDGVRKRIYDKRRIIERSSDYLAYALIDAIVDNYFVVLEHIGERIETLEEELDKNPTQQTLKNINKVKRELIFLRKSIWPLREVLSQLKKTDSKLVKKETMTFINDVYDHTIQVIDTIESLRDIVASMTDLYMSTISNKMNEIMKVLTIFSAIFIPLTFVAGIYGMNFDNMPELHTQNGYFIVLGIFVCMGLGMILFFKKKKWL